MKPITMKREALLKIVKDNKEKHIKDFQESINDYKEAVLKITQENFKIAKTADLEKFKTMKYVPTAPTSHEDSYTKAISMLEHSIDDTLEIDEQLFNQLVLDEWNWKPGFVTASALYKSFSN
jgi:hypothetical protein